MHESTAGNLENDRAENAEQGMSGTDAGSLLLARTVAAHGGDAFLNLKTLKLTGSGEFTTPPQTGGLKVPLASFTYSIAAGGRSRLEARSPGGPVLFVVRGSGRGGFVVLAGRSFELPAEQTDNIEVTEFLRRAVRENYPVTAAGSDGEAVTCDILCPGGAVAHLTLNRTTGLVQKLETETSRGRITLLLSDYQPGPGFPLYGQGQMLENGASVLKLSVTGFEANALLDDRIFERR